VTEALPRTLLLVQLGSTLAMVGVIWIVQVVHYPLFAAVGEAAFADYEAAHTRLITWVVAPLMLAEAGSTLGMALLPDGVGASTIAPGWERWTGVALLGVIWGSTALLQVPQHTRLAQGFDLDAHRWLVLTNWLRTGAWTLRGGLVLLWVSRATG
jgi:hypothetical protein